MTIDKKYVDQIVSVCEKAALASSYLVGKKDIKMVEIQVLDHIIN